MTDATGTWPRRQDVVDAPIREESGRRPLVPVVPGVPVRTVTCSLPGVVEDGPRRDRASLSGEHADLVGIRRCVEVTADDGRPSTPTDLGHVGVEGSHLGLAYVAQIRSPVEHRHEHVDRPAGP